MLITFLYPYSYNRSLSLGKKKIERKQMKGPLVVTREVRVSLNELLLHTH